MDQSVQTTSWQQHIERWQESDLTQRSYCREHNLKPHQFSYWKRKLKSSPSGEDSANETASGFVRIQLEPPPQKMSQLRVQCCDGTELSGINADNVELATQLIRGIR
jgi:transposase-like protein